MTEFQSKILNIHDAFLFEFTKTSTQLDELYKAVNSYIDSIIIKESDTEDNLHVNIANLQAICFFLKETCSKACVYGNLPTATLEKETLAEENTLVPDDLNKILPYEYYSEVFTYSKIDPSKLKVGFEADFIITYIKDSVERSFFIMDSSRTDFVIEQPEFRYDSMPDEGIIFGILLDGCVVRAVRENHLKTPAITFRVLLIDFGEILEISKQYKMYQLPENFQKIPGRAIFCKWALADSADQSFPENMLYTQQTIRIQGILGNMLEVIVNPTGTSKMVKENMKTVKLSQKINLNIQQFASSNRTGDNLTISTNHTNGIPLTTADIKIIKNGLTQEEIDDLYEEPLNTENALEAVMGYVPQDDKKICKFYDPKTNACFKGPNCKLEHETILKDGWTKDKAMVKVKIHSEIPTPQVGKKINLLVSYVVDVERFYGQIIPKKCKSTKDLPVEKIVNEMNDSKMKSKLKPLTLPPGEFELVFAMFTDKLWYRAKVIEKLSDKLWLVCYVDYGNCSSVSMDHLRKWEDAFDCYPFQALECRLDNVSKLKDKHKEAIAYFESLVLHKPVKATVTYNIHSLHVTLQDEKRYDIGEQLCISNYAQQKTITGNVAGQFPG